MFSLLESLAQSLGGDTVNQISDQIGAPPEKTAAAMEMILPALLGALKRNSSDPQGAESIMGALNRDHEGGVLDRLSEFLGNKQYEQPRPRPAAGKADSIGGGILEHILGRKREKVEEGVSKASGLDTAAIGGLMKILAPIVMGALAKQVTSRKLDAQQLPGYLEEETVQLEKQDKKFSLLGKFLDQDGDGDFDFSDIAKLGMGMLFKR